MLMRPGRHSLCACTVALAAHCLDARPAFTLHHPYPARGLSAAKALSWSTCRPSSCFQLIAWVLRCGVVESCLTGHAGKRPPAAKPLSHAPYVRVACAGLCCTCAGEGRGRRRREGREGCFAQACAFCPDGGAMGVLERPHAASGLTLRAFINSALPPAAAISCAAAAAGSIRLLRACDGALTLSMHAMLLVSMQQPGYPS